MSQQVAQRKADTSQTLETFLNLSLVAVLLVSCFLILRPFIPMVSWGIIIAVALYPSFKNLERVLGNRGALAAVICTVILLAVFIVPVFLLAESIVQGVQHVTANIKSGAAVIPPPPPSVEGWPLIGRPLSTLWELASRDISELARRFAPQIKSALPGILTASAGVGLTVLQLLLSIAVAGALLAKAPAAHEVTRALFKRVFGEKGPEFQHMVGSTIRSVTFGILGVAVIQTLLAALGFLVARMPGAGIWSVMFLIGAVLQMGALVLVPAVIYMFAVASSTKAVIFLIWCLVVAVSDNILKPLLLGRGAVVPILVVFLGAIGGFLALGIIGLFVGAIVLSVGYRLFLAWLEQPETGAASA